MISSILLSIEKEKAKKWLKNFDKNSSINTYMFEDNDDSIILHVQGNVDISSHSLEKLPYQFGSIDGSFNASNCGLFTLQNSPKEVSQDYIVSHNNFKNLLGCPEYIGQNFDIQYCNLLSSFANSPQTVIGKYLSSGNSQLKLINKLLTQVGRFSHIVEDKKHSLLGLEKEYLNTNSHYIFQCNGSKLDDYIQLAIKNNPNILTITEGSFGMNGRNFN